MIGFFDSGFGGLTIVKEVAKRLPKYSYVYLGDNARTPYGTRSQDEIFKFTLQGVEFLFAQGVKLVILACNTSSSSALRRIQQEILPEKYPDRNVLGIIAPTVENIGSFTRSGRVGVLATPATVESGAYVREVRKHWPKTEIFQEACPLLVPLIEQGAPPAEIDRVVKSYLDDLFRKSAAIDTLLLGCTHYALIENDIKKAVPAGVNVVSQGSIVAEQLEKYLERHPEITSQLGQDGNRRFYTTGDCLEVERLARIFYGAEIHVEKISLI